MKKVIFIGKTGSGKTTLSQMMNKTDLEYKKTQAVEFYDNIIDTPGEYIENRVYYRALIITAAEADVIALVYDCTQEEGYIPPNFASIFSKEVIGIITKIDLAKDKEQVKRAREQLEAAGATKIFEVSSVKNIGIEDMLNYLR
ncbi:EutP/PduV family microcompartment system protein [Clostridium sp. MSJ-11]|uniref:EutP/PduV family microcompartment system protein n=1 Tax=Clostridium mobile TaxID=2841512 RepID=A0ABS6EDA3_9CLOT|nr:EutP/PduV family microcompartment system protein [Clostridium mobile]MBU5483173.1 EutP/PduV family microcompartment system protein [Clostridium mobile]